MAAAPAGSGPRAVRLATPTRIYQRGSYKGTGSSLASFLKRGEILFMYSTFILNLHLSSVVDPE